MVVRGNCEVRTRNGGEKWWWGCGRWSVVTAQNWWWGTRPLVMVRKPKLELRGSEKADRVAKRAVQDFLGKVTWRKKENGRKIGLSPSRRGAHIPTPADIRYPPHKTNDSGLSHNINNKLASYAHGHSSTHGITWRLSQTISWETDFAKRTTSRWKTLRQQTMCLQIWKETHQTSAVTTGDRWKRCGNRNRNRKPAQPISMNVRRNSNGHRRSPHNNRKRMTSRIWPTLKDMKIHQLQSQKAILLS